jgi:hypothetical protein
VIVEYHKLKKHFKEIQDDQEWVYRDLGFSSEAALNRKIDNLSDSHICALLLDPWRKDAIYDKEHPDYIEDFDYKNVTIRSSSEKIPYFRLFMYSAKL